MGNRKIVDTKDNRENRSGLGRNPFYKKEAKFEGLVRDRKSIEHKR